VPAADVCDGLCYGLRANGVDVTTEAVIRQPIDLVIMIDGARRDPEILARWRAYCPVAVVFTESPYDMDLEMDVAQHVDAGWTQERTTVSAFQAVNSRVKYLPHAWHPDRHFADSQPIGVPIPSHDVVFVGTGFPERVTWLNSIDWTGIDLGLYGIWDGLGLSDQAQECVRGGTVSNVYAAALYRHAKIGLNLYRTRLRGSRDPIIAESLNPRAYELAACGAFSISNHRTEVLEKFRYLVPTITSAVDMEWLIREWLKNDVLRERVKSGLPACVEKDSWTHRAAQVLEDVRTWGLVA